MPQLAVPSPQLRHLLSRFSYGVTPDLVRQAVAAGSPQAWFAQQLAHTQVDDTAANAMRSWFPYLDKTPQQLWSEDQSGGRQGWETGIDLQRWTLVRRIYSRRQLHETMVEFWSNLLHVPAPEPKCWPWRPDYDRVLRTHALGRFEDMLLGCDLHPAMTCYLDNAISTADNVNENLGRELLELHSVGIEAGFSETEVRDSAYILTGYKCDRFDNWVASYSTDDHWRGRVRVLGFDEANAAGDGREMTRRYLRHLANHPATARRIARKLAVRFANDDPSAALVTAVANAFTSSGTDITAALRALVAHPEFAASAGQKIKTPTEDGVATYRALGVKLSRPTTPESGANAIAYQISMIGQAPFDWPRPDGFPDTAEAWTSASRILGSWHAHWSLAGGFWPQQATTFRSPASWLPPLPARFDEVVDHVARQLVAGHASDAMKQAAVAYTGVSASTRIGRSDDLSPFRMAKLLSVILDSPAHMNR